MPRPFAMDPDAGVNLTPELYPQLPERPDVCTCAPDTTCQACKAWFWGMRYRRTHAVEDLDEAIASYKQKRAKVNTHLARWRKQRLTALTIDRQQEVQRHIDAWRRKRQYYQQQLDALYRQQRKAQKG